MNKKQHKGFTLIELPKAVRQGFTLIELLVVITIIVVLLALLVPALDKAIYQAELAVCGTKLKAVANAAVIYASGNKRYYPHRPQMSEATTLWQSSLIYNGNDTVTLGQSQGNYTNTTKFDDRKLLRSFVDINASLNCPLTGEVDLVNSDTDSNVYASYALWYGWRYQNRGGGMRKIGDRIDTNNNESHQVLVSDRDALQFNNNHSQTSHPDKDGIARSAVLQDGEFAVASAGGTDVNVKITISTWRSDGTTRGNVDLNFGQQDGSVTRLLDVPYFPPLVEQDERILWGWEYTDRRYEWPLTLPKR